MEIPESINNLTTETAADQFLITRHQQQSTFSDITDSLRNQLPYQDVKALESGLSFYKKDINSDKEFIKNICHLLSDTLTKAIQTSSINDNNKIEATKALSATIDSFIQNIDGIYQFLRFLNNDANIIDVQKISCIILGYVIDIIKRKNNPKV